MRLVIETDSFVRSATAAGLSDADKFEICNYISANPTAGEIIRGIGGARKVAIARRIIGKRAVCRVIRYYAAEDVPIFLLDLFVDGDAVNPTKAERNELREVLASLVDEYRASANGRPEGEKNKHKRSGPS